MGQTMRRKASIQDVVHATTVVTGVDFVEITSRRRADRILEARELIAIVAMKRLEVSFPDIAESLGKGSGAHATVIGYYRRAIAKDTKQERCNPFARMVDRVNDVLTETEFAADVVAERDMKPSPRPRGPQRAADAAEG
jgi:chromosomal replication initiation ATPase DnaA